MRQRAASAARVIISGGAGAIGAATSDALRRRGAVVVGLDIVASDGVIACDLRDQASVDTAVAEALDRLGGCDALINAAGVGTPQSAGSPPDAAALAVLDINLVGPWRVTAAALPALRASRGRVVNVASGLAYMAVPFGPAYSMSKRGLVAFSDALRAEYGDCITVTTVYPGYIRTPIHRASAAAGVGLEGLVPVEPLSAAVDTLVRAAIGRPARDLATSRRGAVSYAALTHVPPPLVDRLVRAYATRRVRAGALASSALAADYVSRVRAGHRR